LLYSSPDTGDVIRKLFYAPYEGKSQRFKDTKNIMRGFYRAGLKADATDAAALGPAPMGPRAMVFG